MGEGPLEPAFIQLVQCIQQILGRNLLIEICGALSILGNSLGLGPTGWCK